MRWFLAAFLAAELSVCAGHTAAQNELLMAGRPPGIQAARAADPIVASIKIEGLKRVPQQTIRAQIGSREGTHLDRRQVAEDVCALAKLGWFRDIAVGTEPVQPDATRHVELIYRLEENPFLTKVDFAGSRLLSREQIQALLEEKNVAPRTGEPANEAALYRAALAIQEALRGLAHPEARVRIERRESPNATLRARYTIDDGPKITVDKISFRGNPAVPEKQLRAQMREISPEEWFAGLRGKNVYTQEAYESDRARLLNYYADHGYPEAKIGFAKVSAHGTEVRRWLPWPHRAQTIRQTVTIPVEAGRLHRLEKIEAATELKNAAAMKHADAALLGQRPAAKAYSAGAIEQLRRAWFAQINAKPGKITLAQFRGVDAVRTFDPETGNVTVRFGLTSEPPVVVQRIEIRGLHKFKDKYVRRRLSLEEGQPLDERALEAGLTRLTRTGYFRPIKKEDIRVDVYEEKRTAKVTLQLHEIGQQRVSLSGGQSAFGSTLGIVYSVFDLLNREELLSAQIEGGPQSAVLALGLVKDGFLASRGGLAISVFDNVVRPRFSGTVKGPFYTSQSEGINAGWSYAVSASDAVGVNYAITRNVTRYSLNVPETLTGIVPGEVRAKTDSRSVGVSWTHDSGNERRILDGSLSGGWLGGNDNLLRSSAEYGRIVRDPIFNGRNAWAFRIHASGVGSYSGDLPLYARIFSEDELVRGLHQGELGPDAVSSTIGANGATKYLAVPAGSNLVTAANMEYRVPLREGLQGAGFFDLGSGLLLPNWLGAARPSLLEGTNGILHASAGIQLSWTVPGVRVPVRAYYAVNVLRLNRFASLPDGSIFHAHNGLAAFGWALGSLF